VPFRKCYENFGKIRHTTALAAPKVTFHLEYPPVMGINRGAQESQIQIK
jgi:hypothetical protein